ncbi:hypothetical protein C8Q74DRAFT_10809 [Fomes fomentarius]|nr:hypothetical protein C8Q74DRAFT_10809 [Fomes fomentarius]
MISKMTSEKSISKEWSAVVNKLSLCPGYKVALSEDRAATDDPSKLKVDGAIYLSRETPSDGRPRWSHMRALIEFRCGGTSNDPFDDATGDASAQTRTAIRGQDVSHVVHAFTRQQRTAIFMFLINGTKARVTRWERGGTIFTEAFDYVDNPDLFCEFLWRFSLQSDENQGIDITAVLLDTSDDYYKLMDQLAKGPLKHSPLARQPPDVSSYEGNTLPLPARDQDGKEAPIGTFTHVREKFAESLEDGWPRYRVTVPSDEGDRTFLIAKPNFRAPGMIGRGTRGYIVVDVETSLFVWLKDTWRPYYVGIEAEGDILQTLKRAGVTRIPTVLCGGDLMHHTGTRLHRADENATDEGIEGQDDEEPPTGGLPDKSGSDSGARSESSQQQSSYMRHLSHYRLVVNEVCLPLSQLKSPRQLIQVAFAATDAHQQAVKKARIIHGDISVGNVGWCLNDTQGTWQFTSAALLLYWGLRPGIPDEIESLFYLVIYDGVRYLRSSVVEVKEFLNLFFDSYTVMNGRYQCGVYKQLAMTIGALVYHGGAISFFRSPLSSTVEYADHPLNDMVVRMMEVFKARYETLRYRRSFAQWRRFREMKKPAELPTAVHELAQKLDTHDFFMFLLSEMLNLEDWPDEDFVGDQATFRKVAASSRPDRSPEDATTGNDGGRDEEQFTPDPDFPPTPPANRYTRAVRGGRSRAVGRRGWARRVPPA